MPNGTLPQVGQLAATLEELMVAVGRGVGEAQTELDRSSIAMQKAIDADPMLSQHGVAATWYQMPRTEMEIRVALSIQGTQPGGTGATLRKLYLEPVNARYQSLFRFDAQASSLVRLAIVPVPPRTTDALQTPPRMSETAARAVALPFVEKAQGTTEPRSDSRVAANFNAAARVWYVLQFAEVQGQTKTLVVVEVNDQTGVATKR